MGRVATKLNDMSWSREEAVARTENATNNYCLVVVEGEGSNKH